MKIIKRNSGWLKLITVAAILLFSTQAAFAVAVSIGTGSNANEGVYDNGGATPLDSGDLVQIIRAHGEIDDPMPDGSVTGDDEIIATGAIGNGFMFGANGRFTINADVTGGWTVYVRAWNAANAGDATHYGNSEMFSVPGDVGPGDYYNIGSGGGWDVGPFGGDNVPAFETDSEPPALTVAFSSASSSGSEGSTPANLEVSLEYASGDTVTVDYSVTGGTADGAGEDYTLANGTLTFDPGDETQNISITIVNDDLDENNETIVVTLSNPNNADLGAQTTHTYTITDNDAAPSVAFSSGSSNGSENVTPANFTVNLSGASGLTVTVDYSVTGGTADGGGTDYTLANGTLTFNAGDTTENFSATIVNDAWDENDETIVIALSNPSNASLGGNSTHTYTIQDNDSAPTVAFSAASSNGSESATPANMAVTLSGASGLTVTVDYSVTGGTADGGGVDYTLANGTLTFTPGDTSENVSATIINDSWDENNETIIVTLSNPSNASLGGNTAHTYTIQDNDSAPTVAFSAASSNGSESATPANMAVTLSGASGLTVTVDYSVTGGTADGGGVDYTLANGTLTFTPGDTSENVSATIVNDSWDEDDETIIVTLANPSNASLGGNTAHTYTIQDNDEPVLEVNPDSRSFAANENGDNPVDQSVTISNTGNATLNWDADENAAWLTINPDSGSVNAGNSVAMNLSVDITGLAQGNYSETINITSDGGNEDVTVNLTVNPPDAPTVASNTWVENDDEGYVYGTININGENFQDAQDTVEIDGEPVAGGQIHFWSDELIQVGIPLQNGGSYLVAGERTVSVTVGGQDSNDMNFDLNPRIYGFEPDNRAQVGEEITITGTAFGTGNVPVDFEGTIATGSANNESITVTVPEVAVGNKDVTVTINGQESNSLIFQVDGSPQIDVAPIARSFSGVEGGANPGDQTITISNTGTATLNWNATKNEAWLTIAPESGAVNVGASTNMALSINTTGLAEGNYSDTISITSDGGNQDVTVSLTITEELAPVLSVDPISRAFSALEGGANPIDQNITISNTGTALLNWNAAKNEDWLDINPATGDVNAGASEDMIVSVDITGLAEGEYSDTISITSDGGDQDVTISLTINAADTPILTSIEWAEGADSGYVYGTININGLNLGDAVGSVRIEGLEVPEEQIYFWAEEGNLIQVGIPADIDGTFLVAGDLSVTAVVDGVETNNMDFELSPRIYGFQPEADGRPGDPIVITGTAYGAVAGDIAVAFGETAAIVTAADNGSINISVPDMDTGAVDVTLTINGKTSNSMSFTVEESEAPNNAPVANDLEALTIKNIAVDITLEATDADPDDTLTYSVVDEPEHGAVAIEGSVATYTPENDYVGSDSFTYNANDGQADSNTATVTLTVNPAAPNITSVYNKVATDESWAYVTPYDPDWEGEDDDSLNLIIAGAEFGENAPGDVESQEKQNAPEGSTITVKPYGFDEFVAIPADPDNPPDRMYWWEASKIEIGIPDQINDTNVVAGAATVKVQTPGGESEAAFDIKPRIYGMTATGGPGDVVQITGTAFGIDPSRTLVTFGGLVATPESVTSTSFEVTIPEGVEYGATIDVIAIINGVAGNPMEFQVDAEPNQPELAVSPSEMSFVAYVGGNTTAPGSQTITISNAQVGTGGFEFSVTADASWITLTSNSGTVDDAAPLEIISVTIDLTNAPTQAGTYQGNIEISADGIQGSPKQVTVTLEINEVVGPTITNMSVAMAPAGARIEIDGMDFGTTQGASQLMFTKDGASKIAKVISWSDTKIVAEVPIELGKGSYDVEIYKLSIAAEGIDVASKSDAMGFEITAAAVVGLATIYPNPFNPANSETTTIQFNAGSASSIGIYVYDSTARVVSNELLSGVNQTTWDGTDQAGAIVGDGIYLVRVVNEGTKALIAKGKILVIKR